MTRFAQKTISDADVRHALELLKRYPSGLTRKDLEAHFRSDRFGRDVIATLCEQGRAAVINTEDLFGNRVYRLAQTQEEVEGELRKLASYRESLERRREGLQRAWERGGTAEVQKGLF